MEKRSRNRTPPNRSKATTGPEQGILAWTTYQETLRKLDKNLMSQFEKTMSSLRFTFLVNTIVYVLFFVFLVCAFIYGSEPALNNSEQSIFGGVIAIVCLVLLGIMIFRNPVREFAKITRDLAKIQIILQGYNRQLNQVDAAFKQAVLSGDLNVTILSRSVEHLQQIIDNNVESLTSSLEDINL
jgi:hypothetical protein